MSIPRETEQAVFDIAVNSLDFGSGFLDNEEVEHLRAYAEHLGVDPMKATPRNFVCTYSGEGHQWGEWRRIEHTGNEYRHCPVCGNFEYRASNLLTQVLLELNYE